MAWVFECENIPDSLVCQIHPLMKFQHVIKEVFQQVHDKLGASKVNDCFLVDIDFKSDSFIYKAIPCLTLFINKDYSTQPWNR